MNQWVTDHFPWVVAAMGTIGGIVAHIRAYEKSDVRLSWQQHFWGLIRRFVYAGFSGLMVYFAAVEYHWSQPLTCIMAGIVGMFGAEALEFAWEVIKDMMRKYAAKSGGDK